MATQLLPPNPKFRSHQEIPSLVDISEDKMTENCWQSLTGANSAICTLGNCTVFGETSHYHLEISPADTISPRGFLTDLKPLVAIAAGISVLWEISDFHSSTKELGKHRGVVKSFSIFFLSFFVLFFFSFCLISMLFFFFWKVLLQPSFQVYISWPGFISKACQVFWGRLKRVSVLPSKAFSTCMQTYL